MKVLRPHVRLKHWYSSKRLGIRLLLLLLPLLLMAGGFGVRELALRSADQLTITITREQPAPVKVIYHKTFPRAVAAEAERLLNDDAVLGPWPGWANLADNTTFILYEGPIWHYHLAFTWHGIEVETADMTYQTGYESYHISALGLPDLRERRGDPNSRTYFPLIHQLAADAGVPVPPPTPVSAGQQ